MSPPLPLYRPDQARALDEHATRVLGIPAYALMCLAGEAAWRLFRQRWPSVAVLGVACGPGNNGGDGLVLARLAHAAGLQVRLVMLPGAEPTTESSRQAMAQWRESGGTVLVFDGVLPVAELWVDALYGIGLNRAPEGLARTLVEAINASGLPVLALDVPSGLDADTGHAPGASVRATATLEFIAAKRGLYTAMGRELAGEVQCDGLGLPPDAFGDQQPAARLLRAQDLAPWFRPRSRGAHKGDCGHALCIGGEEGMGGAIRLCAEGALRAGAGLVSVAARRSAVAALLAARPEAMGHAVEDAAQLQPLLARARVVAVGPGLGQGEWGRAMFQAALDSGLPLVLDADALNLLAQAARSLPGAVLTPHPGEAARLLDTTTAQVQKDRFQAAQALAHRFGCAVVLKGAGTVVAAPGELPVVIGAGNPGMASGGMGDVLSGVIAALLAQSLAPFDAAVAGALLHSAAADAAAAGGGERGLLASDLLVHLRRLANPA